MGLRCPGPATLAPGTPAPSRLAAATSFRRWPIVLMQDTRTNTHTVPLAHPCTTPVCRWAEKSLGPGALVAEPTHEELHFSGKRFRALEAKCADLAARAQRRLAVSAALRSDVAGGSLHAAGAAAALGLGALAPRASTARAAASPVSWAFLVPLGTSAGDLTHQGCRGQTGHHPTRTHLCSRLVARRRRASARAGRHLYA